MESTFEINTYKFGTDKLYIEIGLVKVWDIEEIGRASCRERV